MMKIHGNKIISNNVDLDLPYAVKSAFHENERIIVLFDPDEAITMKVQFRNLCCFDGCGRKIWEAMLPTDKKGDVYYKIQSSSPLIVLSRSSYECEIDSRTGEITGKTFYK